MLRAFVLSIRQLGDPPILRVLAQSIAITILLFALFGTGMWYGSDAAITALFGLDPDWVSAVIAGMVTVLALWLTFRAVAILIVGILADAIVEAVEARHYPAALKTARPVPLARSLAMGLASVARFIGFNLLLLPAYVILLATGIGTALLFFAVNGWLLGRDLGDMVAARHMPASAMRDWRATTGGQRFVLGLAGTGLFVVPLLNILAPVIGAAMATHLFHRGRT